MTSATGFREASPAQVKQWLDSGACLLVDVREPDEHARERIAKARLNPLSRFDASCVHSLAPLAAGSSTTRIVFHCKAGRRSADAASRAAATAAQGVEIYSLAGGLDAWKLASLPVQVDRATPRLSVMQQTQLVIGLCTLIGSALAYFSHPAFAAIPAFFGAGLAFAGATGTCGLALLLGKMPWNRAFAPQCSSGSCAER